MKILFEDSCILVAVKPQGILSQADSGGGESMVSLLSEYAECEVFPVHRLDKETGGVMVYAKTSSAAAALSREIQNGGFEKQYLCLCYGIPDERKGSYTDLLFRDRQKNKSYVVKRERKGVKKAELEYTLISTPEIEEKTCSLLKIKLLTGRTHQIRVQLSSRKMPLLGDSRYGAKDCFENLALWSYSLEFTHPKTGERMSFLSLPQSYMQKYIPNHLE